MKNNKKGFTLVELLAVIVILALIMGIAVVSIGGVLSSSREKTYRETAASLINAVRQKLYLDGSIAPNTYWVTPAALERGGATSPYGGSYNYNTGEGGCASSVCTLTSTEKDSLGNCGVSSKAYVLIEQQGEDFKYTICLSDGTHFVYATEAALLNDDATNAAIQTGE